MEVEGGGGVGGRVRGREGLGVEGGKQKIEGEDGGYGRGRMVERSSLAQTLEVNS